MVVPGGVECEVAQDFSGGGVDDGDVVVLGEDQDALVGKAAGAGYDLTNLLTQASPYAWVGMSWFDTVEYQMRHMNRLFGELQRRGASTFEITEEANAENRMVMAIAAQ